MHAAALHFEQLQLWQVQPKLQAFDHLRKAKAAEVVTGRGTDGARGQRRAFHDVGAEDMHQDVDELFTLVTAERILDLFGLTA